MWKNLRRLFSAYEMVDVSNKTVLHRTALAEGKVVFTPEGYKHLVEQGSSKGNIQQMAEIAGIMAAKETSKLLPLCHQLNLNKVKVEIQHLPEEFSVLVKSLAISDSLTGVEMEALVAVSVSCLTIYDMCKNFEKNMKINEVKLISKQKLSLSQTILTNLISNYLVFLCAFQSTHIFELLYTAFLLFPLFILHLRRKAFNQQSSQRFKPPVFAHSNITRLYFGKLKFPSLFFIIHFFNILFTRISLEFVH
jgi:cyclic pyranopterin monophosphate synthase